MTVFCEERGSEAAATIARSADVAHVIAGDARLAITGRDGTTWWVALDDAAAQGAQRLLRFGSQTQRSAWLAAQPSWTDAVEQSGPIGRGAPLSLHLELFAGLTDTRVVLDARQDGAGTASLRLERSGRDLVARSGTRPVGADLWARARSELSLLRAHQWREYPPTATDGLLWSLEMSGPLPVQASGANAYPPDGEGPEPSPTFGRLLLACERALGAELWPGWDHHDALDDIDDDRERVEHAVLAGMRAWAEATAGAGVDPAQQTEGQVQKALLPHLRALVPLASGRAPGLEDWAPGNVDVILDSDAGPVWLELKWCKWADTLGNCLWDAGKVAAGVRQGRARFGYLLVGARSSIWSSLPREGVVTTPSWHSDDSLVTEHPRWWRHWWRENPRTYPRRMPTPVVTLPVGRVGPIGDDRDPWEVRLVRVEAPGEETVAVATFG